MGLYVYKIVTKEGVTLDMTVCADTKPYYYHAEKMAKQHCKDKGLNYGIVCSEELYQSKKDVLNSLYGFAYDDTDSISHKSTTGENSVYKLLRAFENALKKQDIVQLKMYHVYVEDDDGYKRIYRHVAVNGTQAVAEVTLMLTRLGKTVVRAEVVDDVI